MVSLAMDGQKGLYAHPHAPTRLSPMLSPLCSGTYTLTYVVGEGTRTEVGRFLSWECAPQAPVNGELGIVLLCPGRASAGCIEC